MSADQFSTVLEKEKHLIKNDTSNVDTDTDMEVTATGRTKCHAECMLFTHTYTRSILYVVFTVTHIPLLPEVQS